MTIELIKRNPVCQDNNSFKGKVDFYLKIRQVCREILEEEKELDQKNLKDIYANVSKLYSRCLGDLKNMAKKLRDTLTEEELKERESMMAILNLNLALVSLKQKNVNHVIKHAQEAIKIDPTNAKAYFRLFQGYKMNNDFELAKAAIIRAIKLQPNDPVLREEHRCLKELKTEKEKQWYTKMNGFYSKSKLTEIDE